MDVEYKGSNGKVVGVLHTDKVYRKKVDSKKHRMRMFDGYGIDKTIVSKLREAGCKEIRILETDTNVIYSTPFENFELHGIEKNFDGVQIFIPIKHCIMTNRNQKPLL